MVINREAERVIIRKTGARKDIALFFASLTKPENTSWESSEKEKP
jgi:hypothetical protein